MLLFPILMAAAAIALAGDRNLVPESNVNSRYTVESVELRPLELSRLSQPLQDRIGGLVGSKFKPEVFQDVADHIRRELRHWAVSFRLDKGTQPESVRVIFEVTRADPEVKLTVPQFVYHSKQNFSFGLDTGWQGDSNIFRLGVLTDNDKLLERHSGIRGGYERIGIVGDRLRAGLMIESWRSQWNPAIGRGLEDAPGVPGIYRTRLQLEPSATITLIRPLTLQLGVSVERVEMQFPSARHELASAAIATLRFQRRWEPLPDRKHQLDASYGLRSATNLLSSDFVYTRQLWSARYRFRGTKDEFSVAAQAGLLQGRAPLFERFILGNSTTLRGWNKYDLAPFGGNRMAHVSVDYRYHWLRMIWDSGSVWSAGATDARLRHSAAVGVASSGTPSVSALVAFPIREGRLEPTFITGLNF